MAGRYAPSKAEYNPRLGAGDGRRLVRAFRGVEGPEVALGHRQRHALDDRTTRGLRQSDNDVASHMFQSRPVTGRAFHVFVRMPMYKAAR